MLLAYKYLYGNLGFHTDKLSLGNLVCAFLAKIFYGILEGKGTKAQSEVVIANAGMSL